MGRKRRKGWWQQLQSDEYPKTKTNYGDSRAANWRPERSPEDIRHTVASNKEQSELQKECPNCGHIYRVDRGCDNCGYSHNGDKLPHAKTQPHQKIKKPIIAKTRYRYTMEELDLLQKYRSFYSSLETGNRVPKTEEQKHFVEVCQGRAKPETTHEKAYVKFIMNRKIQQQDND